MDKTVITKLFLAWDFEKEEDWLNNMSKKGMQLIDVGFCRYTFIKGAPNEYSYKLEFLKNFPNHPESVTYINFLEDAGVEHIGSLFRWVYFRQKSCEGQFDLFSDIDSRITHLKRILILFVLMLVFESSIFISNFGNYMTSKSTTHLILTMIIGFAVGIFAIGIFIMNRKINKLNKDRFIRE